MAIGGGVMSGLLDKLEGLVERKVQERITPILDKLDEMLDELREINNKLERLIELWEQK